MPKLCERGIIQIVPVMILLAGIIAGVIVIQRGTNLFSKAFESKTALSGNICSQNSDCPAGNICLPESSCSIPNSCNKNPNTAYCLILKRFCQGHCTPVAAQKPLEVFNFGFNIRGIIHYGYQDILPQSQKSQIDLDLSEAKNMGVKVIRVFVGNKYISDAEAATRLDQFLTKASEYNISVIPSLIDFYDSGFSPASISQYYVPAPDGNRILKDEFFDKGYKDSGYLDYIKTVVSKNKDHTNIYAWEPGNELRDEVNPDRLISFFNDAAGVIKQYDPDSRVATGMISAAFTKLSAGALYSKTAADIITIHPYNGDRNFLEDVNWSKVNGKKFIVEEIGFASSAFNNRPQKLKDEIDFWKSQGASLILNWGFEAKNLPDNGDGDNQFGIDTFAHKDYDQMAVVITSANQNAAVVPSPSVSPSSKKCDWTKLYPECDWSTNQVRDVYQNTCTKNTQYRNYKYETGSCGYNASPDPSFDKCSPVFKYPECYWQTNQVRDVYQNPCNKTYEYKNYHYQNGSCGYSSIPSPQTVTCYLCDGGEWREAFGGPVNGKYTAESCRSNGYSTDFVKPASCVPPLGICWVCDGGGWRKSGGNPMSAQACSKEQNSAFNQPDKPSWCK